MISGFVVDPDRKKMSKSKGNAVVPTEILERFGADAVRWRAAMARPGMDSPVRRDPDEGRPPARDQGAERDEVRARDRRHAGRPRAVTEPVDTSMLAGLAAPCRGHRGVRGLRLQPRARDQRALLLDVLRRLRRAGQGARLRRGHGAESARAALAVALSVQLRLLAPIMPYATEEAWSWWQDGSVHVAGWPTQQECGDGGDPGLLGAVASALAGIRGAKSSAKVSQRTDVAGAVVTAPGRPRAGAGGCVRPARRPDGWRSRAA